MGHAVGPARLPEPVRPGLRRRVPVRRRRRRRRERRRDQSFGPKLDGRLIDQFTAAQPWVAHPDNVEGLLRRRTHRVRATSPSAAARNARTRACRSARDERPRLHPEQQVPEDLRLAERHDAGDAEVQRRRDAAVHPQQRAQPPGRRLQQRHPRAVHLVRPPGRHERAEGEAVRRRTATCTTGTTTSTTTRSGSSTRTPRRTSATASSARLAARTASSDWLDATLRAGQRLLSRSTSTSSSRAGNLQLLPTRTIAGAFSTCTTVATRRNTDLLLTANRQLTSKRRRQRDVRLATRRAQPISTKTTATRRGFSVPRIYNVSNAAITPTLTQTDSRRRVNSVFGSASFTSDGWWTVEGHGAQRLVVDAADGEQLVLLPVGQHVARAHRRVSGAAVERAVVREAARRDRARRHRRRPVPAPHDVHGSSNKFGALPLFALSDTLANAEPQARDHDARTRRVSSSASSTAASRSTRLLRKSTNNQILNLTVSPTSGFNSIAINAGEIENKGCEVLLGATPVRLANGFEWTTSVTCARNRGERRIELSGSPADGPRPSRGTPLSKRR